MKKAKFLQSSKDMLSKSFNSSKCKVSLKLAISRLKLLRNKKEVQVKQMKREIAQLLETGQNQTARIRVEHVIREEKMMSAFDLIEIYCELIVARITIIESQKHCPIDLKEALTSVIFACPRIGDVPELVDVKKHLTAKYGKDFATAALELRPDCGVSRMVVEKLSAVAPDGQTKIKVLSAIAEEHNIKWDPTFFEEKESSTPNNDLLNGPVTFGNENKVHVETPNFQAPQNNTEAHGSSSKFYQQHHRTSMETKATAHPQVPGVNKAEPIQGDINGLSTQNKQRWNMDFKDATSAARAAAESAEMASMAARAAAELSSRGKIIEQYANESHESDVYVSRNEARKSYNVNSDLRSEQFSQPDNTISSGNSRLGSPQVIGSRYDNDERLEEENHEDTRRYSQPSSLKEDSAGSSASMKRDSFKDPRIFKNIREKQADNVQRFEEDNHGGARRYRQQSSLKEDSRGSGVRMKRESFKDSTKFENVREKQPMRQPSSRSSRSSRSTSSVSDDINVFSTSDDQKYHYKKDERLSSPSNSKKDVVRESSFTGSHESAAVVFDDYDSDGEVHGFDTGPIYDELEPEIHSSSPSSRPTEHIPPNRFPSSYKSGSAETIHTSSQSLFFTRQRSSSDLSVKSESVDNSDARAVFDNSDGTSSESDLDMKMPSSHLGQKDSSDLLRSGSKSEKSSGFSLKESPTDDFETSSPESKEGLNFKKLTGGFRQKGYNQSLPYKNRSDDSSPFKKAGKEPATFTTTSAAESSRIVKHSELDSDSSGDEDKEEEESLRKVSAHNQKLHKPGDVKNIKAKPSLKAAVVSEEDSDFDDDTPKKTTHKNTHLRSGISRRTKASRSSPYTNPRLRSETLDLEAGSDKTRATSHASESPKRSADNYEQPNKPSRSNYWGPPEPFKSTKVTSGTFQDSRTSQKSSEAEENSSLRSEDNEVAALNKASSISSKKDDNDTKKASHVHPKLPDYDTFVQAIRKNRS